MPNPVAPAARQIQRLEAGLTRILSWVVVFLLCFSTAGAFFGVVARYFFNASFDIVEELCLMAVVYASLLYFGPLITRNAHLTMAFLTDKLTERGGRWFDLALYICMTALLGWMLKVAWGWEMGLVNMGLSTMSGEMKAWIPSAALPIGLAVAVLYSALRVLYRIAGIQMTTSGMEE